MKIKNYKVWFDRWYSRYDWALPLRASLDGWGGGYFSASMSILCFSISFSIMSEECSRNEDEMFEENIKRNT